MPFRSARFRQLMSGGSVPIVLALILMFMLAACGGGASTTGSMAKTTATPMPAPNDLLTPGTLTVGSDTTYPPQEYINTATGKPAGFDIDLITAIAQRMGRKLW